MTDQTPPNTIEQRKVFGRRKGKPLTPLRQELVDAVLPKLRLPLTGTAGETLDPATLFAPPKQRLWMEIGFGGGEHLAWQAAQHPNTGFIGAEPFMNGVASMVRHVDTGGLTNVRLWDDDARTVLRALPDNSLDRVFALFQDPWPKTRHAHRRIINGDVLDLMARVMPSGGVFRWATDHPIFLRWSLNQCLTHDQFVWQVTNQNDWTHRPDDWPETRYEAKAIREGRTPRYFTFVRV